MTVKEALHQLVDQMSDEAAGQALDYLQFLARDVDHAPNGEVAAHDEERTATHRGPVSPEEAKLLAEAQPLTFDDPLWKLVGIVGDEYDGPSDVSSNKYKYLAEAYADLHDE